MANQEEEEETVARALAEKRITRYFCLLNLHGDGDNLIV